MKKMQSVVAVFLFFISLINPQSVDFRRTIRTSPMVPAGYKLWPNTVRHAKNLPSGLKLTGFVYLRTYGDAEIQKQYLYPEMVEEIRVNGQPVYYFVLQGGLLSSFKKPGKLTISVLQKDRTFVVQETVLLGKVDGVEVTSVIRGMSNEELTAFRKELGTKTLKFAENPIISKE